jgi:hypothetical protein
MLSEASKRTRRSFRLFRIAALRPDLLYQGALPRHDCATFEDMFARLDNCVVAHGAPPLEQAGAPSRLSATGAWLCRCR